MRQKISCKRVIWHLAVVLFLAAFLVPISALPAAAQGVGEYFEISYDVDFSQTGIEGDELFYALIRGEATCLEDLPVAVTEGRITSRVVAEHQASGSKVTLNQSYTVIIRPFPQQKGDTYIIEKDVPLQFGRYGEPGIYNVSGELIEAKLRVDIGGIAFWEDVTSYLPASQNMGQVMYTPVPAISWEFGYGPELFPSPSPANDRPYLDIGVDLPTASEPEQLLGVYWLDETEREWKFFIPGWGEDNTLRSLEAGQAYLVQVSGACTWEIPQEE